MPDGFFDALMKVANGSPATNDRYHEGILKGFELAIRAATAEASKLGALNVAAEIAKLRLEKK